MKISFIRKTSLSFSLLLSIIITNTAFASILPRTEENFLNQFISGFISQLRIMFM